MIQTVIVYIFLLFSMILLVSVTFKLQGYHLSDNLIGVKNFPLFAAMILFATVFGMSYGVGRDHLHYMEYYNELKLGIYNGKIMEPGFGFITKMLGKASLHYSLYFSFLAFIQIFFILYAFKRNEKKILPFLIITMILGGTFLSLMNGIRQQISFCIFVFSLEFIVRKKPIRHYIFIFIAFLFHSSVLILLPVYVLFRFKKDYFKRISIQLILLSAALIILYLNYIKEIMFILKGVMDFLGYGRYFVAFESGQQSLLFSNDKSRGLGFVILLIINIILITGSNKVKEYFSSSLFKIIYNLYFVGVIYGYITNGSIMLGRINYYFLGFKFIVAAYTLSYYFKTMKVSKMNALLFVGLLALYLLIFVAIMYRMDENTSRFVFFWQKNLYYLKQ